VAGDWVKMRARLAEDHAVMVICDLTGLDEFGVVGRLHAIWSWAGEHTVTGDVHDVTRRTVDRVTRHEGFADAMIAAKWLEERENGGLRFPSWKKFNGKAAKERALAAVRQARKRAKSHGTKRDAHRDATVTNHAPREEKSREEKSREELSPNGDKKSAAAAASSKRKIYEIDSAEALIPETLDTQDFRSAWLDWIAYRRSENKSLTIIAAKSQLQDLARYGPVVAIDAIRHSIRNQYQGLFPEKAAQNANRPGTATAPVHDPNRRLQGFG
jgi:cobalamin-dependent methionine synthase I